MMMSKLIKHLVSCVSASIMVFSFWGVASAEEGERTQFLEDLVAGHNPVAPALSGIQLIAIKDGEVAFEFTKGFARYPVDETTENLTLDHKMRVASISKMVAALGMMRLVEDGKLDLDRDVSDYLGFSLRNPHFPDTKITTRMLVAHTSSIRDGDYYWLSEGGNIADFFLADGEHYHEGVQFAHEPGQGPGEYFTYTNLNFGVLASVMERASGERFDHILERQILEPLDLTASFNACEVSAKHPDQLVPLYRKRDKDGNWVPSGPWRAQVDDEEVICHYGHKGVKIGEEPAPILSDYMLGENGTLFSPQGGLRASANDLKNIALMMLSGGEFNGKQILTADSVRQLVSPVWTYDDTLKNGNTTDVESGDASESFGLFHSYGLSVHRTNLKIWGATERDYWLVGHLGDAYGMIGHFWLDVKNKDALIVLMTGTADNPGAGKVVTPLYSSGDQIMKWWVTHFSR